MSIHVALRHVTHYRYDRAVELSPQLVRLRPAPHCRTPILSYSQRITPADAFPQLAAGSAEQLRRAADVSREGARVPRRDRPGRRDGRLQSVRLLPRAVRRARSRSPTSRRELRELQPFLHAEPLTPRLARYLAAIERRRRPTIDILVELNRQLQQRHLATSSGSIPGVQAPERHARAGVRLVPRHAPGCWCSCSAISGSPRASSPAI